MVILTPKHQTGLLQNCANMDLMFIIFTFNRPKALAECLRTVISNTSIRPDSMFILDDGSDVTLQTNLANFCLENKNQKSNLSVYLNGYNRGVGHQFQLAYSLIKQYSPKIVFLVEGDYYFRKSYIEDCLALFESMPTCIAIPAMDHSDMRKPEKYNGIFVDLMKEQFGEDIEGRQYMYRNFEVDTTEGKMEVFGCSNSCGAQILHWERINKFIFDDLGAEQEYWKHMDRGFHVGRDRNRASDAHMSCTHSYLWEKWAIKNNVDLTKNFGYINILPSLSFHACNQGLNGMLDPKIFPEGGDFSGVNSGTFPKDYNNWIRLSDKINMKNIELLGGVSVADPKFLGTPQTK